MCGIVGFQGDFSRDLLARMSAQVAHRGPDGAGEVILQSESGSPTGLGHRRLSIIDLSERGSQPMCAPADRAGGMRTGLTLVFNGEIYNFRELRGELESAGHSFRSRTDSEVLLHLYERDGLAMLERLNGIFAFALHDAREEGRPPGVPRGGVFLARDQMGVKPLYYAETARGVLFASEIKALLEEPSLPRDIDPVALHNTLAYLWSPAPRTLLGSVRKLEPGQAMLVHDSRILRRWTYYEIPYDGSPSTASEAEIAAELAARLRTAVDRQLVSDVPVGAFLSGGLDSSAIVAMMRASRPGERIPCFSIGFRGAREVEGNPSDLPYARKVARHLDVDLHEIEVEPDAIRRLPEMISLLDEPQADPAPINALIIAEHARAMGIPVLLSGAGGDDLFSGLRRHWAVGFERNWEWLPLPVRSGMQRVAHAAASGRMGGQSIKPIRRLAKMFAYAGLDRDRRLASHLMWSTDEVRRSLYSEGFARQVVDVDTAAPMLASLSRIPAEDDSLQRMLYLEARHFLADHNLNYTDRAGMAVGVEIRVPILDLDIVELAARTPARFKQKGAVSKAIFKKAMEPYLPREVIYRPKSGFAVPLRRWLRNELRPMVEESLSPSRLRKRGVFDPDAVARFIAADQRGQIDGSYTIFALMCIEMWCEHFLDK